MKINNLHFAYRKGQALIDDLSLDLESGHIYGLLGQNGAGKSTLLKLMAGLCFPDAGKIQVLDTEPQAREIHFLQNLFFMPEDFTLPALTMAKYGHFYGRFYPHFDEALFKKALATFGLNPTMTLPALSYGQKKMFMIAFALSTHAKILILDEPTNGLDIPNKEVWQKLLIENVSDDQLVIISTHQVHDIAGLIDGVIVMKEGKILLNALTIDLEDRLYCAIQSEAPKPDSVFYAENGAGGYVVLRANKGEEPTTIDLSLLFRALLQNSQISKLFVKENKNG